MKLIDKSALVAEIESLWKHYLDAQEFDFGWNQALDKVLSCLDTLEVKEVELDKHQIADIIENLFPTDQFIESETLLLNKEEAIIFAKHFFELGLKVK